MKGGNGDQRFSIDVNYIPDEHGVWDAYSIKRLQAYIERQTLPLELLELAPELREGLDHMLRHKKQRWRVEILAHPDQNGLWTKETLDRLHGHIWDATRANDLLYQVRALRALDRRLRWWPFGEQARLEKFNRKTEDNWRREAGWLVFPGSGNPELDHEDIRTHLRNNGLLRRALERVPGLKAAANTVKKVRARNGSKG